MAQTEGWKVLVAICSEQIGNKQKRLEFCKVDELQAIQGEISGLRFLLNEVNDIIKDKYEPTEGKPAGV